jgi:hypothetical protein
MKTNTLPTKPKTFKMADVVKAAFYIITRDKGYVSKDLASDTRKSTNSVVNEYVRSGMLAAGSDVDGFYVDFLFHHVNIGTFEGKLSLLDKKHNHFIVEGYKSGEVESEDLGTVVYIVNRYMNLMKLRELSSPFISSSWLCKELGKTDYYFIKITHIITNPNNIYFRFQDRYNNIGSFFTAITPTFTAIKVDDCIGISAKLRLKKTNRFTGVKETVFSEVEVIENVGSK